jgi:HNH endonuclease
LLIAAVLFSPLNVRFFYTHLFLSPFWCHVFKLLSFLSSTSLHQVLHLILIVFIFFLDIAQLAQQLNTVRFDVDHANPTRYVTAWISGQQQSIQFARSFGSLVESVAVIFEMEKDLLRIYVLQAPAFSWSGRIRLTEENFDDYIRHEGDFVRTSKLYACGNTSPDGSPGEKKVDVGEGSQPSRNSNRSGQGEFSEAVRWRDKNTCVFCESTSVELEAAHVIPVKQYDLLRDYSNNAKYGIGSVMDTANGILLCRNCHRCFDAYLVCIDPATGKLLIAEALLANEPDKWKRLQDRIVSVHNPVTWPNMELLKFRMNAMNSATESRHEKQENFRLYCMFCYKGYKKKNLLENHQRKCGTNRRTPSTYTTPLKGTDNGEADDDDEVDDDGETCGDGEVDDDCQVKMGRG